MDYYSYIADQLIEAGAPEICLKDMAGIGRPEMLGQLVRNIKDKHPEVIVQYHGHSGPGLSMASILEVCENGADIIDVAMEPLSWGKVHPDVISVQAMLKNAGFQVPEINMKAYMKARSMTQEFIDDFLGYFIDPTNKHMSSLLLGCGLPGGMMGSMMADLKGVHSGINLIPVSYTHLHQSVFLDHHSDWQCIPCWFHAIHRQSTDFANHCSSNSHLRLIQNFR